MKKMNAATSGFAVVVLAIVAILIVPLPPLALDALLAFNVLFAGGVLLLSVTVTDPLEFAAFAPALLLATLFRLALDVSATRLILTRGHEPGGVGDVIPAFGEFVVRGNLVVGLIVFAILVTIQFIVIASGSQRVAEVAARFTLDAMPGKQMAIDAELHAGLLDAETAKHKRAAVQREADFYGAMDGAGKFVKGDAIAALVIVALNLVGGVAVGVGYHGLSIADAVSTYAILSIGNALVTTVPAFLLSIAMGMMVTRVAAEASLGSDLARQLLARPEVLRIVGTLAFVLALVPALPRAVFLVLGVLAFAAAHLAARRRHAATADDARADADKARAERRRPENALAAVGIDPVAIDFGLDLVGMLSAENGEALLDKISEIRRIVASETGVVIPGVRLRDDQTADPLTYTIRVRDEAVAGGALRVDKFLAVGRSAALEGLDGEPVRDPVYGLPARWIAPDDRDAAQRNGVLVFDPISIIGSHLGEVARRHAPAIFGRQELHTLIEHLKRTQPAVVKDVGSDLLPVATLHKAFSLLLRERVWPRDPVATIEAMADAAGTSRDPRDLAEAARRVLVGPQLRRAPSRVLPALLVDPNFEHVLLGMWSGSEGLAPDPGVAVFVRDRVTAYLANVPPGRGAVLCSTAFRRPLADLLDRFRIDVDVFAFAELPPEIEVRPAAVLDAPPVATLAVAS